MEPLNDEDIAEFIKAIQNLQAPKEQTKVRKYDLPQYSASTNSAWQLGQLPWELFGDDPPRQKKDNTKPEEISEEMLELGLNCALVMGLVIGSVTVIIIFALLFMAMRG